MQKERTPHNGRPFGFISICVRRRGRIAESVRASASLHQRDERERAFERKFAVDLELEGNFGIHLFVSGIRVRHFAGVEFGSVAVKRQIYAQRSADNRDFGNDVAVSAVGVALFADSAFDFGVPLGVSVRAAFRTAYLSFTISSERAYFSAKLRLLRAAFFSLRFQCPPPCREK